MRRVISKEEAEELIREIPQIEGLWIGSEKQREEKYKEMHEKLQMCRMGADHPNLYQRKMSRLKQGKKITVTDERYLRMAEGNLYSELSIALGIPESGMEAYITNQINETEGTGTLLMQGTGSSGYNGCEKNGGSSEKG